MTDRRAVVVAFVVSALSGAGVGLAIGVVLG